jgi:hypothetical protein
MPNNKRKSNKSGANKSSKVHPDAKLPESLPVTQATEALSVEKAKEPHSISESIIKIILPIVVTVFIGIIQYINAITGTTKVILSIGVGYIAAIIIITWELYKHKELKQIHIIISLYCVILPISLFTIFLADSYYKIEDKLETITAQVNLPIPIETIEGISSQIASLSFRPIMTVTPTSTPLLFTPTFSVIPKNLPRIYSDNKGGMLLNYGCPEWMNCRTARYSNNYTPNQYSGIVRASFLSASNYEVSRIYLFFNTSEIPSNTTIVNAKLHLCSASTLIGNTMIHIVESTASTNFGVYDYSRIGNKSGGNIEFVSENECGEIDINSEGISWIKRGIIVLAIVHDYDLNNIKPIIENEIEIALSLDKDNRPFMEIAYTNN